MTTLLVRQKKEWGEILTSFETRNRYEIIDPAGEVRYLAGEEGGFIMRQFLQSLRPFTMRIATPDGQSALTVKRPFRFYFHRVDVQGPSGEAMGSVERKFSWLRRMYRVLDPAGREIYTIIGPILHPWTFRILENETEVGRISKKWSGLGKEFFTDADTFSVTFPDNLDLQRKCTLLGAVFLIDFAHFERKRSNK
ncbi:scramblase [bacterium]|nr:scramblase [bacterium]